MTSSLTWLLPAWIIGAPLLGAIVNLMSTPKADRSLDRPHVASLDSSQLRRTAV